MVGSDSISSGVELALRGAGLCMADSWGSCSRVCSLSDCRECIVLEVEARKEIAGGLEGPRQRKERVVVGLYSPCRCWLLIQKTLVLVG